METSSSFLSFVSALVLCTSFVKVATALSIVRFALGLVGSECGVATLVAAFGLTVVAAPPELKAAGVPTVFIDGNNVPGPEQIKKALVPYMIKRIDTHVAVALSVPRDDRGEILPDAATVVPAFLVSELQEALSIGCALLVPFVALDLLIAHLLTIVGIRQIQAHVVSLPCKLLLFVSVDGWTMLTKKLLGL